MSIPAPHVPLREIKEIDTCCSVLQCVLQCVSVWKGLFERDQRDILTVPPRLFERRGRTHSYLWHDSCICATWLIHMYVMTLWETWGAERSFYTFQWVMLRINESCHIWMSHVTHLNESCHTYEWVMSHIWMSHGTHMYESCHTWMSHVTHMNESCHTYTWVMSHMNESYHTHEWVMSHIWMSHVTYMNESCYTCEWVMADVCMSHVTHMNESCHTYEWVMSHIWMSHAYEWVMSHTVPHIYVLQHP